MAEKIVVYDKQPMEYGKWKVKIPGIAAQEIGQVNKLVDGIYDNFNRTAPPEKQIRKIKDLSGALIYPRYLSFQKDKTQPETFWIKPTVLNQVLDLVKRGREVERESQSAQQPQQAVSHETLRDVEVLGLETTPQGKKIVVRFNLPFAKTKAVIDSVKSFGQDAAYYTGKDGKFHISATNPFLYKKVREALASQELDLHSLDNFVRENKLFEYKAAQTGGQHDKAIQFSDDEGDSIKIRIIWPKMDVDERKFIEQAVTYVFPQSKYDKQNYTYHVRGNYKQYVQFGRLLKNEKEEIATNEQQPEQDENEGRPFGKHEFDVDALRKIVAKKIEDGRLKQERYEGQFATSEEKKEMFEKGYSKKQVEDAAREKFINSIDDDFPESNIDFYDEQKEGIAFLYSRDHAILGDQTGVGKSAQLVAAAELKSKKMYSGKPILLFTLGETQKQWTDEIANILGEKERSNISFDVMSPKKWTIVKYSSFQNDPEKNKRVKDSIAIVRKTNYGIVIFDELHKLKKGDSWRSFNIEEAIKDIPTRWGATATLSSNEPGDVKNQLSITGHYLGKISDEQFDKDFAGKLDKNRFKHLNNVEFQDYAHEKKVRAAENLNKWLNMTGVYVRRKKSELKRMPKLNITHAEVPFNSSEYERLKHTLVNSYQGGPNKPTNRLMAARRAMATVKTDPTVHEALNIVKENMDNPYHNYAPSKVVIFTNFIDAFDKLYNLLNKELKSINPEFKVLTYGGNVKKNARESIKQQFNNDPNAKILLMSMKIGSTGINFPNTAQNMIVNDFDWTPESAEQSEGRIYRINTTHPVNIKYMVGKGIDSLLFQKVSRKRELADIVQRYRRKYQKTHNDKYLDKIVDLQKEIEDLNKDIADTEAGEIAHESSEYDAMKAALREELLYGMEAV